MIIPVSLVLACWKDQPIIVIPRAANLIVDLLRGSFVLRAA